MKKYFKLMRFDYADVNEENRKKWIEEQLLSLPQGTSILDAGAGPLRWKKTCSHLKYTSQDFCQYDGTGNQKGIQYQIFDTSKIDIVSDIVNIPVDSNSFDTVLCSEVLEHLPYPEMALKEFSRILCRGGGIDFNCSVLQSDPYGAISFLYRV